MANILIRNPYYHSGSATNALSAVLTLSIDGTQRYEVTKNTDSSNNVFFEISELVRDYLSINYGNNEVANGNFANGSTNWTKTENGEVAIANGVATFSNTSELTKIEQSNVFIDENYYEITYEITEKTSGNLRIPRFINDTNDGVDLVTTVGVHTIRGKAYNTTLTIKRQGDPTNLSITNISVNGGYNSQVAAVSGSIIFYLGLNGSGSAVGGANIAISDNAFDGYKEFFEVSDGKPQIPNNTNLISNTRLYVPKNVSGLIPNTTTNGAITYTEFSSTATSITINNTLFTITRIGECKYNPIRVTFVNKFGALQDIYFDMKSVEGLNVKRDSFNRSLFSTTDGSYGIGSHQKKTFNVLAKEVITLNTGFVDEGMNEPIKQLLLSEQCWITINGVQFPVIPTDTSKTFKTSVNDRLINHTIKFDYAFDLINNIR